MGDLHPFPLDPVDWVEIKLIKFPAPEGVPYNEIYQYLGNRYLEPTHRRLCINPKLGQKLLYQIPFDDLLRWANPMQFEIQQKQKQGCYKQLLRAENAKEGVMSFVNLDPQSR